MSTTELGRLKLVTDRREMALPAVCFFTGSDREEYFIDTDRDTDEGRVYIGKQQAEEIAKLIGWVSLPSPEKEVEKLQKENDVLRTLIRAQYATATEFVSTVNAKLDEALSRGNSVPPTVPGEQSTKPGESSKGLDG